MPSNDDEVQVTYGSLAPSAMYEATADVVSITENEYDSHSRESSRAPIFAPPRPPEIQIPFQLPHILSGNYYPRIPRNDLEAKEQEHHNGKRRFLDDLNNFVPLGSIHAVALDGFFLADKWHEHPPYEIIGIDSSNTRGFRQLWSLCLEGLVRLVTKRLTESLSGCIIRVYLLSDDVGRRWIDRGGGPNEARRVSLKILMKYIIDFSAESWNGHYIGHEQFRSLGRCFTDPDRDDLLFYTFNTIASPAPDDVFILCPFSRDAAAALLDPSSAVNGLKTSLYPYQRRSAATMVRREIQPARTLDPRLEALEGPVGNTIYYDERTMTLLRDKRTYEEPRGGILAETMGLGKTLICLAVILATRGHWPRIPPEFSTNLYPIRHKVGKLVDMTAAAIARQQIPWRYYFQEVAQNESCVAILEKNVGSYTIVPRTAKHTRRPSMALKEQVIRLCPVTLVVVPVNLFHHWQNEMASHIEKDALRVILVRTMDSPMPTEDEIIVSDVVIIIKQRFEREMKPLDPSYESPLKSLHFLRIIVDEGHDFGASSAGTNAIFALQKLHVDRRWIVSGTPTTGLLGVEVGIAAKETSDGTEVPPSTSLVKMRSGASQEQVEERKDLERLGRIVKDFFQLRPWANSKGDDAASWQEYVIPHKDGSRKLRSLRSILESLVVRHRLEDVEKDIQLPPLYNRVVPLPPTWQDKLSLNLFSLNLVINAITSERTDQDYMFHYKNRGKLSILIGNLRQAGFYWTGHRPVEMSKALDLAESYVQKRISSEGAIEETDRWLLSKASSIGKAALLSDTWKGLSELDELGVYVEGFPNDAQEAWSLVKPVPVKGPLLLAATHLANAQKFGDSHLYAFNPADGFAEAGRNVLQSAWDNAARRSDGKTSPTDPADVPKLLSKNTISQSKTGQSPRKKKEVSTPKNRSELTAPAQSSLGVKSALKNVSKNHLSSPISAESQLAKTMICGFSSAKLAYLMDQVIALHQNEKIIIFYEGNHIAYYIAQALELIDVRYLIYTGTLAERRKAAYITTFNATENFRVMLMDLSQAAHGLHIASASRVFFVNPVWQPKIEAQAIKRAHRIGQTKPVFVETIVLEGTLEDEMRSRRKNMSTEEHRRAEKSLLDDEVMKRIIQNVKFIPMSTEQENDTHPYGRLKVPQQLFGRISGDARGLGDPDADLIFPGEEPAVRPSPKRAAPVSPITERPRKKVVGFVTG